MGFVLKLSAISRGCPRAESRFRPGQVGRPPGLPWADEEVRPTEMDLFWLKAEC
jgi:hypothetical protein